MPKGPELFPVGGRNLYGETAGGNTAEGGFLRVAIGSRTYALRSKKFPGTLENNSFFGEELFKRSEPTLII